MDRRKIIALLFVCYGLVAVLRLTAPSDIDNRDQAKQGLYVLDIVQKGSFFLPTERGSRLATKPPLYNWAGAVMSLAWGKVSDLTIKLPAVLSGLGVVLITFLVTEILFSKEVGLFASLVLILNFHFTNLSCTARTDMMFSFFISLSLYFFLVAYRERSEKSIYNTLIFVSMGLGSITKGPVALLLPVLVILVFLFFMRDLKWLKLMHFGRGIAIWLVIILSWFVPALIEGGREFFDIVVYDEMVNRFLGIGARAGKTRPFYYLVGHFFGKFLPWSLFVPSAIVSYWKSKNETEKYGLLFPVVWFLTVLIFFSLSKGKRSDYLLPLYPAASVIVGQFWFSLVRRDEPDHRTSHLRTLSLGYLLVCFSMAAGLLMLWAEPELGEAVARLFPRTSEKINLLQGSARTGAYLLVLTAIPLAITSILGAALAAKRNLKALFMALSVAAGLYLSMYFEIMSPEATMRGGKRKKTFCLRAAEKMDSVENLNFSEVVQNSMLFYMGRNIRSLNRNEVLEFFRSADKPYLITTEADYLALRESAHFEFLVLEESEYLISEKGKYVLLGRGPIRNFRPSHNGEKQR